MCAEYALPFNTDVHRRGWCLAPFFGGPYRSTDALFRSGPATSDRRMISRFVLGSDFRPQFQGPRVARPLSACARLAPYVGPDSAPLFGPAPACGMGARLAARGEAKMCLRVEVSLDAPRCSLVHGPVGLKTQEDRKNGCFVSLHVVQDGRQHYRFHLVARRARVSLVESWEPWRRRMCVGVRVPMVQRCQVRLGSLHG